MYENMSYEMILDQMLDAVPAMFDKREGSIIHDALAPAALVATNIYMALDSILQETFADTASREYLILRAKERGIIPIPASNALTKGVFNIDIPIGSRFSLDDLNYIVMRKIDGEHVYQLKCETPGEVGNSKLGTLVPVNYIDGLTSAEITEIMIPGENEEDTDNIRSRYYATLNSQSYGGNITDYKLKVNAIQGVGGVKVYTGTKWNGGGTVKLVILNSLYNQPTKALIDKTQSEIDPIMNHGEGVGIAPIGHIVTVVGVNKVAVDISSEIVYQGGYSWGDVKEAVEETIDTYFTELNRSWADNDNIIVRISQIEIRLLNLNGIIDISHTKVNGVEENYTVEKDSIVARGEVHG